MAASPAPGFSPEDLLSFMRQAHRRERTLIKDLGDAEIRAESALPGWSRGHVLGSRLAFMRAARRQIHCGLTGQQTDFFDGGRPGRDAEIQAYAVQSAAELIEQVRQSVAILESEWARIGPADWARPVIYRGPGILTDVLAGCWRETEIHIVDLDLGVRPAHWSRELCVHLFAYLEPRAPEGVQLVLSAPDGGSWTLGSGERVVVSGALTDLAAWLSGRHPDRRLECSAGSLPQLRRLRMPPPVAAPPRQMPQPRSGA